VCARIAIDRARGRFSCARPSNPYKICRKGTALTARKQVIVRATCGAAGLCTRAFQRDLLLLRLGVDMTTAGEGAETLPWDSWGATVHPTKGRRVTRHTCMCWCRRKAVPHFTV